MSATLLPKHGDSWIEARLAEILEREHIMKDVPPEEPAAETPDWVLKDVDLVLPKVMH